MGCTQSHSNEPSANRPVSQPSAPLPPESIDHNHEFYSKSVHPICSPTPSQLNHHHQQNSTVLNRLEEEVSPTKSTSAVPPHHSRFFLPQLPEEHISFEIRKTNGDSFISTSSTRQSANFFSQHFGEDVPIVQTQLQKKDITATTPTNPKNNSSIRQFFTQPLRGSTSENTRNSSSTTISATTQPKSSSPRHNINASSTLPITTTPNLNKMESISSAEYLKNVPPPSPSMSQEERTPSFYHRQIDLHAQQQNQRKPSSPFRVNSPQPLDGTEDKEYTLFTDPARLSQLSHNQQKRSSFSRMMFKMNGDDASVSSNELYNSPPQHQQQQPPPHQVRDTSHFSPVRTGHDQQPSYRRSPFLQQQQQPPLDPFVTDSTSTSASFTPQNFGQPHSQISPQCNGSNFCDQQYYQGFQSSSSDGLSFRFSASMDAPSPRPVHHFPEMNMQPPSPFQARLVTPTDTFGNPTIRVSTGLPTNSPYRRSMVSPQQHQQPLHNPRLSIHDKTRKNATMLTTTAEISTPNYTPLYSVHSSPTTPSDNFSTISHRGITPSPSVEPLKTKFFPDIPSQTRQASYPRSPFSALPENEPIPREQLIHYTQQYPTYSHSTTSSNSGVTTYGSFPIPHAHLENNNFDILSHSMERKPINLNENLHGTSMNDNDEFCMSGAYPFTFQHNRGLYNYSAGRDPLSLDLLHIPPESSMETLPSSQQLSSSEIPHDNLSHTSDSDSDRHSRLDPSQQPEPQQRKPIKGKNHHFNRSKHVKKQTPKTGETAVSTTPRRK